MTSCVRCFNREVRNPGAICDTCQGLPPKGYCTGCGYHRVVHGTHRGDCTVQQTALHQALTTSPR